MSSDNQEPVAVEQRDRARLAVLKRDLEPYRGKTIGSLRIDMGEVQAILSVLDHLTTRPQPTASEDEIRKARHMAAGGCYCKDACGAPVIMGRQTKCLRNPPLQPGQPIAAKAQEAGDFPTPPESSTTPE